MRRAYTHGSFAANRDLRGMEKLRPGHTVEPEASLRLEGPGAELASECVQLDEWANGGAVNGVLRVL